MRELSNPTWIQVKRFFSVPETLSATLLFLDHPTPKIGILLVLSVWVCVDSTTSRFMSWNAMDPLSIFRSPVACTISAREKTRPSDACCAQSHQLQNSALNTLI